MTLENRINQAKANRYEAEQRLKQLSRERAQLEENCRERLYGWRIESMKQGILIAEIKKNRILGRSLLLAARGDNLEFYGLPIQ